MSNYNGRRGPNVSQYLRDLNTISPQDTTGEENFNMEDELSFFTNTQFFDLDSGQNTDFQAPPVKPDPVATPAGSSTEDPASVMGDISNMDFMNGELGGISICLRSHFCYYFVDMCSILAAQPIIPSSPHTPLLTSDHMASHSHSSAKDDTSQVTPPSILDPHAPYYTLARKLRRLYALLQPWCGSCHTQAPPTVQMTNWERLRNIS